MLESIYDCMAIVKRFWILNPPSPLSDGDWNCMLDILNILAFPKEMTSLLQGSSFPTSTHFWPLYFDTLLIWRDYVPTTQMGHDLVDKLVERWIAQGAILLFEPESRDLHFVSIGFAPWTWTSSVGPGGARVYNFVLANTPSLRK
jgi:hypothetical protein